MPIPDFQSLMLPVLRFASDGAEHSTPEAVDALADQLQLTDDERAQLLPSGTQRTFANRVAWAVSYLKQARLLTTPSRGRYVISDAGRDVLKAPPERITIRYLLDTSPEYRESRATPGKKRIKRGVVDDVGQPEDDRTPEEQIEAAEHSLRVALENDLLDRVKQSTPDFFERIVLQLLLAMGYGGTLADAVSS